MVRLFASAFKRRYPHFKSTLSRRLLDFAESLPEAKRGAVHHLQQVRHYQRRHAEQDDATPPDGATIRLGSIRVIEAYSVEQFSGLVRSVAKMFPDGDNLGERDHVAKIDNAIRSLDAGAWFNVGRIIRERRGFMLVRPYRELPQLPSQVRAIEVNVEHLMPSIAIITLDVELSDEGAQELERIHGRSYIGEVTLRSLFKWDSGHSEKPADWVRAEEIRTWVDRVRSSVEGVLRPFIEPGLFGRFSSEHPKLPAVETYLLESGAAIRDESWHRKMHGWLDSYGIGWTYDVYRSDSNLFQWARRRSHHETVSSHIVVAFREQYRTATQHPEAYGGEVHAILHHVESSLRALMRVSALKR